MQSVKPNLKIGVLALQGDFDAHRHVLEACGAMVVPVRAPEHLEGLNGLIIPGGESTVMSRLCDRYHLWEPLHKRIEGGLGVLGTCAGMILMAHGLTGTTKNFVQKALNVVDIYVERNAYGAQLDSFEADVTVPILNATIRGVFIRAPRVARIGPKVEVLAEYDGSPVVIRQGKHLAVAFHPEIAGDTRLHRFWLEGLEKE